MNLTGNLTMLTGSLINLSGVSCTSGTCQNAGTLNITAYNITINGQILAEGGFALGNAGAHTSGNGGTIRIINASVIYINGNISVSSDYFTSSTNIFIGGNAGKIFINATTVNITENGVVNARGGNADSEIRKTDSH